MTSYSVEHCRHMIAQCVGFVLNRTPNAGVNATYWLAFWRGKLEEAKRQETQKAL